MKDWCENLLTRSVFFNRGSSSEPKGSANGIQGFCWGSLQCSPDPLACCLFSKNLFLALSLKFHKFLATHMGSVSNQNCWKGFCFKDKVEKHHTRCCRSHCVYDAASNCLTSAYIFKKTKIKVIISLHRNKTCTSSEYHYFYYMKHFSNANIYHFHNGFDEILRICGLINIIFLFISITVTVIIIIMHKVYKDIMRISISQL